MSGVEFEWDMEKDLVNQQKHGVSFFEAQMAFLDPRRVIARDLSHSNVEERHYCLRKVHDAIMTVRFTYRDETIRIIGAGYWRKGKMIYERQQALLQ